MRIKWSKNAEVGEVDIWFDGAKVVDAAKAKTLNDDNGHFAQFGLLRGDADFADVPVIYIDDAVEGVTLEDIRIDAHLVPTVMDESEVEKDVGTDAADLMTDADAAQSTEDMKASKDMSSSVPDASIEKDVGSQSPIDNSISGTGGCSTTGNSSLMLLVLFGFIGFFPRRKKG